MSAVAQLYNVPTTPQEFAVWSSAHATHHRDINRTVYEAFQIALPEFLLDPFDIRDSEAWQYQHQQMHQLQDAILGIAGFNLTRVEFTDPRQLAGWIFIHATEHKEAADILGIG